MCGIAGVLVLGRRSGEVLSPAERCAADRMLRSASLNRRGPDHRASKEIRAGGRTAGILVSTRLAVTDHANPEANMPFLSPDGDLALVFNGEIYNHASLRAQLRSRFAFRTRSDMEVVLAAYAAWGEELFAHLEGMYAFCLVDGRRARAVLAVDHAGQKPLYYHLDGDRLVFASDLDALLASGLVPFELDVATLQELAVERYVRDERTHVRGVHKLLNGTYAVADLLGDGGGPAVRRHFLLDVDEHRLDTVAHAERELAAALAASNEDVVAGAELQPAFLLSGGVDSSSIVALAARSLPSVRAYTLAFPGAGPGAFVGETPDVAAFADGIAASGRGRLVRVEVPLERESFGALVDRWAAEVPHLLFARDAVFLLHLFTAVRRDGHKVAVTGCGPDEVFDGYGHGVAFEEATADGYPLALAHYSVTRLLGGIDTGRLLWNGEAEVAARIAAKVERVLALYPGALSPLQKAQLLNWHTHSQYECLKSDAAASVLGLEARKPHYTRRLIQLAFAFPAAWKRVDGQDKWIFRRALEASGILPASVANRRKWAFPSPLGLHRDPEWRERVGDVLRGDNALRRCAAVDVDVAVEFFEQDRPDDLVSEMVYGLCLTLEREERIARAARRPG